MTSNDFCNWLKGFLELTEQKEVTADQVECIQRHLAMVFKYEIDPSYGDDAVQDVLNELHNHWHVEPNSDKLIRC